MVLKLRQMGRRESRDLLARGRAVRLSSGVAHLHAKVADSILEIWAECPWMSQLLPDGECRTEIQLAGQLHPQSGWGGRAGRGVSGCESGPENGSSVGGPYQVVRNREILSTSHIGKLCAPKPHTRSKARD